MKQKPGIGLERVKGLSKVNDELINLMERWPMVAKFNLPPNSAVLVVGAYKGISMKLIQELYHPRVLIGYEPQLWAVVEAMQTLQATNGVVFNWGLGVESGRFPMGEWNTDGCSFINVDSREQGVGLMWNADQALKVLELPVIDLMVMNIEGYEFELIPYLHDKGWLNHIDRLAVQFHTGFPNEYKMPGTIKLLDDNYKKRTWDELPSWGMWE